jgi:hypothetical protein
MKLLFEMPVKSSDGLNAGKLTSRLCPGESYARVQVRMVAELTQGKGIDYPGIRQNMTGATQTSRRATAPAS